MWQSLVESKYIKHKYSRLCQGDILRDITLAEWSSEKIEGDEFVIETVARQLPYAVVLTQDCDLEQDYNNRNDGDRRNNDKYLSAILLCPAYPAAQVQEGSHLKGLDLVMQEIKGPIWKSLKQNHLYRYHYLADNLDLQVPELVLDFKHTLAAPRDELYRQSMNGQYLASLNELYRENLSDRYAYFLARIALPVL